MIAARNTVATGTLPLAEPPATYTLPLKMTAPAECSAAGNAVVVLQAVTAPVALRVPTRTVATGLPLAVLSPPIKYRYDDPVTCELVGVATTAAAKATGAGRTVVLVQAPTLPVFETVAYSTLSRGTSVLSAPPATYTTLVGVVPGSVAAASAWPCGPPRTAGLPWS